MQCAQNVSTFSGSAINYLNVRDEKQKKIKFKDIVTLIKLYG